MVKSTTCENVSDMLLFLHQGAVQRFLRMIIFAVSEQLLFTHFGQTIAALIGTQMRHLTNA
jgi:hypothetical protein